MPIVDLYKALPIHLRSPKVLKEKVLLFGAGGVGTWFALLFTLASDPIESAITVWDDDVLEIHNANRLPYPLPWFGRGVPKIVALKEMVLRLRPGYNIVTRMKRLNEQTYSVALSDASKASVIVDAVDDMETIHLIWRLGWDSSKPVLSLHYDGEHGSIMWLPPKAERPVIWGEDGRGYTFPSWAATPAALAAAGLELLARKPTETVHIAF